tara:strand:- start:2255 stop:3310 length:1056 start_codon:yes stop_codon:yes gene_type:complete
MSKENQRDFTVDGVKYAVRRPKITEIRNANEQRSKAFNEALSRGDMLREQLDSELRKRSLWNDSREEEYQNLRKGILDGEFRLKKGGIKLSDAKDVALDMSEHRSRMVELLSSRTDLDSNTCEGKADAVRFNCLFASCLVYEETGESYFPKGIDDYLLNQDDPVAIAGATEFYYLISNSERPDEQLPENVFLKQFDFVDEGFNLVDKDGKRTDRKGRHIDEFGNLIKWVNEDSYIHVDTEGREVSDDGEFNVEFSPFLTDDGEPIVVDEDPEQDKQEEKPKKKTTRKKTTTTRKKAAPKKKVAKKAKAEVPEPEEPEVETPEVESEAPAEEAEVEDTTVVEEVDEDTSETS